MYIEETTANNGLAKAGLLEFLKQFAGMKLFCRNVILFSSLRQAAAVSRNIKMKQHKTKFNEITKLLKDKLGDGILAYEKHGTEFIEIKNTKFWLTIDENEFTVGYGLNHKHFSEEYGDLFEGIIQAFDLLTNKIKITDFIKGNTIFKTIIEIEYPNLELVNIGETGIIFFPYWKKTKIVSFISNPIIDKKEIENEVNKIINY